MLFSFSRGRLNICPQGGPSGRTPLWAYIAERGLPPAPKGAVCTMSISKANLCIVAPVVGTFNILPPLWAIYCPKGDAAREPPQGTTTRLLAKLTLAKLTLAKLIFAESNICPKGLREKAYIAIAPSAVSLYGYADPRCVLLRSCPPFGPGG